MPTEATPTQAALTVAFRHYDDDTTTSAERDAILSAMADHMPSREAETAGRALHHRHEAREQQMQLAGLLKKTTA